MEHKYLYQVLPFLKHIDKERRLKIEQYFMSAPVWLMESFRIVKLDKGVTFIRENAPVDMVYIIGEGIIKATEYRVFGIAFDFMRFDGIYGMGAMEIVMDLERYRTTLQTVTPCTMIAIPKAQFEKWLKTDIKALKQEAKAIGEYLLEQGRKSRTFLFLQGSDRLCMVFTDKYERDAKQGVFVCKNTRQELSEESGLCVKTINRAVKQFEEQGYITRVGNKIVINQQQYQCMKEIISQVIDQ